MPSSIHNLPAVGVPEEKGALGTDLPSPGEKDVFTSFAEDPEMKNLTLLERKMVIVNRTLNSFGMGRYQWSIFFLCGLGYLIDLAFAKLFGLILSPLATELNISAKARGNLSSCFSAGLCIGAICWGILVDVIGRKWAFNSSLFVTSFFGLFLGVPDSYTAICVLALFCGLGLGGNIPIDATIVLETIPARNRWLLVILSVFQPLGVLLCSLISWGLIPSRTCDLKLPSCKIVAEGVECCRKADNMGWRLASYTIGGLCLTLFIARFVVFRFRESPKYLLIKGRDQDAIDVIHSIAKFNKTTVDIKLEDLQKVERDFIETASDSQATYKTEQPIIKKKLAMYNLSHMKVLFSSKRLAWITILIFFIYMFDYFAFSLAGTFLPTILREKGAARAVSTQETYRNYIIQACSGIPGVALGAALTEIRALGQKWSMAITAIGMGVSLCLYAVINSQDANVAFNALEYFFQSSFNAILYGSAPLYFPTAVRGTGVGTASSLGRMIGIVSPLIGAQIYAQADGLNSILFVAGAPMFAAAILCAFLPNIRRGHTY